MRWPRELAPARHAAHQLGAPPPLELVTDKLLVRKSHWQQWFSCIWAGHALCGNGFRGERRPSIRSRPSSGFRIKIRNSWTPCRLPLHAILYTAASPGASRLAIYYKKCADAHPDGRCDIPEDDPAYRLGLDKDHNGIACESRKT